MSFLIHFLYTLINRLNYFICKYQLAYLGNNTIIHPTATFRTPQGIRIGQNCHIFEFVILDGRTEKPLGGVNIGNHTMIKPKAYLSSNGSSIVIGDYVYIGHNAWLGGKSEISIGDNTMIGVNTVIVSSNHDYRNVTVPYYLGDEILAPVTIGKNVWIASNCVILPGSQIGDNAVIAAGSIIKGVIPPYSFAHGALATFQIRQD